MRKWLKPKRDRVMAVDLGGWATKAVYLERKDGGIKLLDYYIERTGAGHSTPNRALLTEHFRDMSRALNPRTKNVVIALNRQECWLRNIEVPTVHRSELRQILKVNSQHYLQTDLSSSEIDCSFVAQEFGDWISQEETAESTALTLANPSKGKFQTRAMVTVGGAERGFVEELTAGVTGAGLLPEEVTFSQIGLINAANSGLPQLRRYPAVALVDIGLKQSSISILSGGRLLLNRMVEGGGDQLTQRVADALSWNYAAAEAVKLTMPEKVEDKVRGALAPIAQELRAVIAFFEHRSEKTVQLALISGASARSELILGILREELMTPCERWDALQAVELALPSHRTPDFQLAAPHLSAAIGAGLAWMEEGEFRINLLAEQQEEAARKRRDPVRWAKAASVASVAPMVLWAGSLVMEQNQAKKELDRLGAEINSSQSAFKDSSLLSSQTAETIEIIDHLEAIRTNRFSRAGALNALQFCMVDGVQVVQVSFDSAIQHTPGVVKTRYSNAEPRPAQNVSALSMTITAKDYASPSGAEAFIKSLAGSPYFQASLRPENPILLKERMPARPDPYHPSKQFVLFRIECVFEERVAYEE